MHSYDPRASLSSQNFVTNEQYWCLTRILSEFSAGCTGKERKLLDMQIAARAGAANKRVSIVNHQFPMHLMSKFMCTMHEVRSIPTWKDHGL